MLIITIINPIVALSFRGIRVTQVPKKHCNDLPWTSLLATRTVVIEQNLLSTNLLSSYFRGTNVSVSSKIF